MFILEIPLVTPMTTPNGATGPTKVQGSKTDGIKPPAVKEDNFTASTKATDPAKLRAEFSQNYSDLASQLLEAIAKGDNEKAILLRRQIRNLQNTYNDQRQSMGLQPERLELTDEKAKEFAKGLTNIANENAKTTDEIIRNIGSGGDADALRASMENLQKCKEISDVLRQALGLPQQAGIELTSAQRATHQSALNRLPGEIADAESELTRAYGGRDPDAAREALNHLTRLKTLYGFAKEILGR